MIQTTYEKFIKEVSIIGIAQVLSYFGSFLLIPVITKTLGAHQYGIWIQITITIALLSPLSHLGLMMAMMRFLAVEKERERICEGFYSIIFFVAGTATLIAILVFLLSDLLSRTVFQDPSTAYYIQVSCILILLSTLDQFIILYYRIFNQIRRYAVLKTVESFFQLGLILLLIYTGFGLLGVIAATALVQISIIIVSLIGIISQIGFTFPKFTRLHEFLGYGVPLTPNGIIRWITDSSDRYFIGYLLGLSMVGIYSVAYNISGIISFFIYPIQIVLLPELSRLYDQNKIDEVKKYLSYSTKYFLFIAIPAVFGLSVLSEPLIAILATENFLAGSVVILPVSLSFLLGGVFQVLINITHLVKKTKLNFGIHLIAAIFNIILNILLIPILGMFGAALATLVSYGIMTGICYKVSISFLPFSIDIPFLGKSIFSTGVMVGFLIVLHPVGLTQVLLAVAGGSIIYFIIIYLLHGFEEKEVRMARDLISSYFPRLS